MSGRVLLCLVFAVGWASVSRGVTVAGGTGTEQTTDPGSGLPWGYVGTVNGASGVFLGDYSGNFWVLTASHVVGSGSSLANFVQGGNSYSFVPGSGIDVHNTDNSSSDLTLFRISSGPALTNLTLASSVPAFGSQVALVGYGVRETSSQLFWNVTGSGDGTTWNALGSSSGANASGYDTGSAGVERWGLTNTVDPSSVGTTGSYNVGTGATTSLVTEFLGSVGSAQAGGGDSGGAMFYYTGSTWELAGILGAVGTFTNQPAGTAVFGDVTYAGSIANYNSTILSDISAIPEPADLALWCGLPALALVGWRRRRGV